MLEYYDDGKKLFVDVDIYLNCVKIGETPLHAHNFTEIAFIAEGEGIHKIGDREYNCKKGEIYMINHDVPHQFIANESSKFIIYNCVFKPDFFDFSLIDSKAFYDITYDFLMKTIGSDTIVKTPKGALTKDVFRTVHTIFEEMLMEYEGKDEGFIELLKANLIRLVVFMLRAMKEEKKQTNELTEKNQLLEKVNQYIHRNFYKEITVEELSMQAFLSQSHFCRLFKEYSGVTVKEFTRQIRINEACRLLKNTNKKVADIAFEVGYSDIKYFNSLFKKLIGNTPNEYRRSF